MEDSLTKLMMHRYGFTHYSAITEFMKGKSMLEDKCDREVASVNGESPIKSFTRVTQIEPSNPYSWAYLLFAMEDAGGYTVKQLAGVAEKWSEAAIKYRFQAQNALALAYLMEYARKEDRMESDTE